MVVKSKGEPVFVVHEQPCNPTCNNAARSPQIKMATITKQDLKRTWKIGYASRVHFRRPCFSSCTELHKMAVLLFGRLFVLSFNHAYWSILVAKSCQELSARS